MDDTTTAEEIARAYTAAMDSVNLITEGQPSGMDNDEWADNLQRNRDHLNIMLSKGYWTTEDLQPLRDAVATAEPTRLQ